MEPIPFRDSVPQRPCCNAEICPRAEILRGLNQENPIEHRVDFAATSIANTCPLLDPSELAYCFGVMFETNPGCRLFDRFQAAYQTERDMIDGNRLIRVKCSGAPE